MVADSCRDAYPPHSVCRPVLYLRTFLVEELVDWLPQLCWYYGPVPSVMDFELENPHPASGVTNDVTWLYNLVCNKINAQMEKGALVPLGLLLQ